MVGLVNDKLKRILKNAIMAELRYYNKHLAAGTEENHEQYQSG
jgi:hypothetical protein